MLPQNPQSVAYKFGIEAAQSGEPCVPEAIFVRRADQVQFAHGYESVTGPTFTTVQFTGAELPKPAPVAKKSHGWAEYNAERAIKRHSAHLAFVESIFERTAKETPYLAGDLLWLPS